MRGSFLHAGRYNIEGYFGALYTSMEAETARLEIGRYFTVSPKEKMAESRIELTLTRVVDLSNAMNRKKAGIRMEQLTSGDHAFAQGVGLEAWRNGVEALLVPSAAIPAKDNLVVLLDNQTPGWSVRLAETRLETW